jgi:uncharacterized protein YcbX
MPKVVELNSYPIKSCAPVSYEYATIDEFGLPHDREWMVADMLGKFISQRTHPRLALVRPIVESHHIAVTGPGMSDLSIDTDDTDFPTVEAVVWGKDSPAIAQPDDANEWFSEYLDESVQLVRRDPNNKRQVSEPRRIDGAYANVGFADGAPILLTTTPSLGAVNERLVVAGADQIPMNRFRPNIVVGPSPDESLEPFDEDFWRTLEIDGLELFASWACTRCIMIETDQATANRGKTVLKALQGFRRGVDSNDPTNKGTFFGVNMLVGASAPQVVSVGQTVSINERSDSRNVDGLSY